MRFLFQILLHILVTAAGVLMIVFGLQDSNTTLWVWGIIVLVAGNLVVYLLLFLLGLLLIFAARSQDSLTGVNKNSISNRTKFCKKCGTEVEYSIMICPTCGNKTYTETKPLTVEPKQEEDK